MKVMYEVVVSSLRVQVVVFASTETGVAGYKVVVCLVSVSLLNPARAEAHRDRRAIDLVKSIIVKSRKLLGSYGCEFSKMYSEIRNGRDR